MYKRQVYGVYAAEPILHPDQKTGQLYEKDRLVAEMTTDGQARAVLEDLYLGSYYIRELHRSTGYELCAKTYPVTIADPGQDTPVVTVEASVEEQVIRQAVELHKTTDEGTLLDHSGFCFYPVSYTHLDVYKRQDQVFYGSRQFL